jgi:hypothetical protein
MNSLTISAKGQVTLRTDLLKHLGAEPGGKISVDKLPDGRLEVRAVPTGKISDVFGMLKRANRRPISIEQVNANITSSWAGKK